MTNYCGTIDQLRKLRRYMKDLDAAGQSAKALRFVESADRLWAEMAALAESVCYVPVDCILCGVGQQVPVKVGELGEPEAVLCGACNERTEREVCDGNVTT